MTCLLYFPHFKLLPESTRLLSLLKVFIIKPTIYNQDGTQLNHNSQSKNIPPYVKQDWQTKHEVYPKKPYI